MNVAGISNLSCGLNAPYATDIENTPGTYEGQDYPPLQSTRVLNIC